MSKLTDEDVERIAKRVAELVGRTTVINYPTQFRPYEPDWLEPPIWYPRGRYPITVTNNTRNV